MSSTPIDYAILPAPTDLGKNQSLPPHSSEIILTWGSKTRTLILDEAPAAKAEGIYLYGESLQTPQVVIREEISFDEKTWHPSNGYCAAGPGGRDDD